MVSEENIANSGGDEVEPALVDSASKKFWCNFCNFEADNLQVYLAHSCTAELESRGIVVPETGSNECR